MTNIATRKTTSEKNATAAKSQARRKKGTKKAEKSANGFEIDRSPTARALMKAFRMTHERLHGAKAKRA